MPDDPLPDDTVEQALHPLIEKLLLRLEGGENVELEYKAAQGGLPKNLWETICAFANTLGGWVILGMEVRDGKLRADGVRNASAQIKALFDLMRSAQKISYPVCGNQDVSVESLDDKDIILIRTPAAPRKARPVYINQNPYTGTYLRRHEGDYHATKPEVDRMMREASDVGADSAILARYSLDDVDRDALARYRRRHQTQHPDAPWAGYDDLQFLKALNGYRRERMTGAEGLTVAGLLMFGTAEAIREWRGRHLIDYRVLRAGSGAGAETSWDDRVEWEGNLFGAYETVSPKLVRDQPAPFALYGDVRAAEGPIHVALREALVNLLVHADYAETQPSLILHASDRYFFRNPGSSRVPESDLLSGDRSDPRNPELVRMFRLVGLAEEAGTGIPRILATWRSLGLQTPRIDVGTERYEFALELRHAHLLSDEDRQWLRTLGAHWTEAEQLALVCARHEGGIDNFRLRQLTGLHPADATKTLGALRSRGLLVMVRGGRGAYYRLPSTMTTERTQTDRRRAFEQGAFADWASGAPSTGDNTLSIGDNTLSIGDNTLSIGDNTLSIGDNSSGAYEPELLALSASARKRRRMRPAERDEMIVQMCAIQPLSIQEVSLLLGRSVEHMRNVVQLLIARGKLSYLYPHQPQHPNQRYQAVGRT